MKKKKLDEIKTKRIKGIYCLLSNVEMNTIPLNGVQKDFYNKNFEIDTISLITKKYYGALGPSNSYALLKILRDETYNNEIIPFLEQINNIYREFNKVVEVDGYTINDDFWIDSNIEGKIGWTDWYL